jgi:hypothetical protein
LTEKETGKKKNMDTGRVKSTKVETNKDGRHDKKEVEKE